MKIFEKLTTQNQDTKKILNDIEQIRSDAVKAHYKLGESINDAFQAGVYQKIQNDLDHIWFLLNRIVDKL